MIGFVVRRLALSVPVLFVLSVVVFAAAHASASPETALATTAGISSEDVLRYRADLGLDRPATEQYLSWLGDFVRGDLGESLVSRRPVWPQLRDALGNTLVLGVTAVSFSLVIGLGIGTVSALKRYSLLDSAATLAAFLGLSMPVFWSALMLQLFFGVYMVGWFDLREPWLYTAGMTAPGSQGFDLVDRLRHLALPALVVSIQLIAVYSRYMRSSMLEVLDADHLRTARSKGLRERRVIVRHGMRNALIPVTTQVAVDVGLLVGGLIVTEQIFQWPGMGVLFLRAMDRGDYQVVLPWLMITAAAVVVANLVADLVYGVLDPRIRVR